MKTTEKLTRTLLQGVLPERLQRFFAKGEFPLLDGRDVAPTYGPLRPGKRFQLSLEVPVCELCC